jgi:choline dehydrogenase
VLAERLSDLIRGRHLPEAQGAQLLADPQWATRQRGQNITRDYANERHRLAAALLANVKGAPLPMAAG